MKNFCVALISLLTFVVGAFAGPFDAWSSYRDITINTTSAGGGANVASTLTNIPVLVRLSNVDASLGADVLTQAGANGASLRFSNADGSVSLPFDIQYWSTSRAAIWVRVPVVEGNATTTIRMYWGNGFVPNASTPGAVFNADNGYVAAWHLGNASGAAARPNAVTGGNPAVPGGSATASMNPAAGIIGMADTLRSQDALDNTTRDHLNIGSGYADFSTGITISVWAYPITVGNWQKFIEIGNGAPDKNIALGRENATQNLQFEYYPGPAGEWSGQSVFGPNAIEQNTWQYFAATMGPDNIRRVYKNGALVGGPSTAGPALPVVTRNNGYIGRTNFNDRQYRGKMEAMRIAKVARSDDWLKFEYETQKAGATAVALGASQAQASTFAYGILSSSYQVLSPITPNTPVINGTVSNISVSPALPAGLTIDPMTGVISGTPTATTAEGIYKVTAVFSAPAVTVTVDLNIGVKPLAPTALAYPTTTAAYALNQAIAANVPTVNSLTDPNQLVAGFTVSPALPAGLALNPTTGTISGTPTAASAPTNYTITASNTGGSTTAVVNIAVLAVPGTPVYSQNPAIITGGLSAPIVPLKATATGSQLKWSVTPALPAGLTLDSATGTISGTPMSAASGSFTVSATNISGASSVNLDLTVTAPENYATWAGSAEYVLNAAAAGATTPQVGYPLLVRLTSAHAAIFTGAKADGSDIRFSKADGSRLAFERESWNQAGNSAAFWVLLDTLPASGTVTLRIHYGNQAAASISSGSRVFNTAKGFQAVWHMNGGTGNEIDATANGFLATQSGAPTDVATGAVGAARGFNGSNQWFQVNGSAGSVLSFPVNGNYSLSTWALFTPGSNDNNRTIVGKHDQEYGLSLSGSGAASWQFFQYSNGGWATMTAPKTNAVWQLVTAVKEGANTYLYVNGVRSIGPVTSANTNGRNLGTDVNIGRRGDNNSRHWRGNLDELRMLNVSLSADWIKLDYETQAASAAPISGLTYASNSYTFSDNGQPITPVAAPTLQTGSATSFSVSPALPPDLSLNTTTGVITGTPTNFMPPTPFVVTARSGAWVASQTLTLEISPTAPSNIVYAANPVVYEAGLVVSGNAPTNDGTITSWSVSPALPAGLTLNALTGVISGEPVAAAAAAVYQVKGTGPVGETSVNVTITVLPPSEDFSSWAHSRNIVLNTSASGADVAGTVTNFPVLVRLGQAEAAVFSQTLAGGADVRFAKANGVTRLSYEIAGWNATAKTAEIWVKLDTVYGNNPTQSIKMFWGKSGVADSSHGTRVFAASNGYVTTFHMGNPAGDPATSVRPNSVNPGTNDATPAFIGAHPNVVTQGVIGLADTLRGQGGAANGDHFNFGALATTNYPNGLTLSLWAKPTSYTGDFVQFYTIGNISNGNGVSAQTVWLGKRAGGNDLSAEVAGSTRIDAQGGLGTAALNQWQHYSYSVLPGGAGARLYRNGVLVAQTNNTQNLANVARTSNFIGRANWPDNTFNGVVDEVRFSNTARSADFVKLEYQNQNRFQVLANIGYQAPVLAFTADSVNGAAGFAITEATMSIEGTVSAPLSISPALPDGLMFNVTTGSITGTPTVVYPSTVHTVTATNNGATATDSIVITIAAPTLPGKPVVVAPTFNAANVSPSGRVVWNRVAPPVTSYRLQGSGDSTFATTYLDTTVTDTSFALSFAPYNARVHVRVRANNIAGSGPWSDSVSFNTGIAPPSITYTTPRVLVKGVVDSLIAFSMGGAVASYSVTPALPSGLTLNTTTGRISGTPTTVTAAADYVVTATNATGSATATVNIAVVDLTPVFSYTPSTLSFTRNVAITPPALSSTGGAVTTWSVAPALPAGLTLTTAGALSGTPTTAAAAANYVVTGSNAYGSATATLNITVLPGLPVIAYAGTPKTFIKGVVDSLPVSSTGGAVASYAVAPALPAGLTLNTTTGRIGGTPTAASAAANYTVTATNASGMATATVNIQVQDLTPVVNYAALVDSFTVNIAATKTPTSTGGTVTAWSVTPALPAGLTLNATTGVIGGTPTAATATANYTVVAANAYGADTVVLSLKVLQPTAIMGGAYTFRVSGVEKPYSFMLPAGASATEQVTMRITDVWGRNVWTRTVRPNANGTATEVVWTGRTKTGLLASAGMYVVRVSVLNDGKVTEYVQKSVTLKSR